MVYASPMTNEPLSLEWSQRYRRQTELKASAPLDPDRAAALAAFCAGYGGNYDPDRNLFWIPRLYTMEHLEKLFALKKLPVRLEERGEAKTLKRRLAEVRRYGNPSGFDREAPAGFGMYDDLPWKEQPLDYLKESLASPENPVSVVREMALLELEARNVLDQAEEANAGTVMAQGMFKGERLDQVPDQYLEHLFREVFKPDHPKRKMVEMEMKRRKRLGVAIGKRERSRNRPEEKTLTLRGEHYGKPWSAVPDYYLEFLVREMDNEYGWWAELERVRRARKKEKSI